MTKRVITRVFLIRDDKFIVLPRKYTEKEYGGAFGNATYVLLPGGKVDDGESLEECAVRETKEELGVDIHKLTKIYHLENEERDITFFVSEYGDGWSGDPQLMEPEKFEELVWMDAMEMVDRDPGVWNDHWLVGDGIRDAAACLVGNYPTVQY